MSAGFIGEASIFTLRIDPDAGEIECLWRLQEECKPVSYYCKSEVRAENGALTRGHPLVDHSPSKQELEIGYIQRLLHTIVEPPPSMVVVVQLGLYDKVAEG